ncbi:MAG: NADH-quinone oxidoreductase subunit L [Candidatus Krumholzibacteria bacterium]|nr:NADH-quinone oxidoreductase subunit L [Candidatus Krumholzibacteria bacterium]
MNDLLYIIIVAAVAGIIPLLVPRKASIVAGVTSLIAAVWIFILSMQLFRAGEIAWSVPLFNLGGEIPFEFALRLTGFSSFVLLFISLFGVLIILYSLGYMKGKGQASIYYSYLMWTLAAAAGVVMADNLLILLVFWEILTAILFFLINMGGEGHEKAAAKTFTILGFTDATMLLGIILIWTTFGTISISELAANPIVPSSPVTITAFICLFIGAIAKAGGMPFHSWIPAIAKPTHASVIAFLPASLDKLLGIYLLGLLTLRIFAIEPGGALSMMMMIVGVCTIIFAVLMALVQHNLKKLLSFHAISQVGYMVLGVGSGIPVAIAGGLFHMVNHAIYKSGLFLGAGAVEKMTGTTELEDLGGLAKLMPVTFITMIITAFSISGVPPFNGFVSKWLVYQGMLEGKYMIFLIAAIFGSALTMASFIKVLHSIFLGRRPEKFDGVREVGFSMQLPMIFIAILCIGFGIFASYPLQNFILPVVSGAGAISTSGFEVVTESTNGFWSPVSATILMVVGLVVGIIIFAFGRIKKNLRYDDNPWIGGNILENEEMRIPGTHFYKTVTDELNPIVTGAFHDGEKGAFDLFNIFGRLGDLVVQFLRSMHDGILSTYLSWAVIGLGVLAFILMFRW